MPKKVLKINTHLPAIPDWLKINNSITLPLPLKSAKELAKKLLEVREDVEIELNFAAGKETIVEIKYEQKKEEQIPS
jgi:S-adenosylmethionine synthetase